MNKYLLSLFVFLFLTSGVKADYGVLARNQADGKATFLGKGATVRFTYSGYEGQYQEVFGQIIEVNDTNVILQTGTLLNKDTFSLRIQDIQGFKYYPLSKQVGKLAFDLGLLTGNILFYTQVLSPAPISPFARVGISLATGALSWGVKKLIFTDKVKNTKEKGWDFIAYNAS